MAHEFDPGYRGAFAKLVRAYPGETVYPSKDFRTEWGPVFHRGRLDGSARVVVIGQDPATHETISRRILVGEAGQRLQGFLAKLGIERSYAMVNTFLYSVYGQGGGARHKDDPKIAKYRHRWLDALIVGKQVEAVVTLGQLADHAWQTWRQTPKGASVNVAYAAMVHPTYPESSSAGGQTTLAHAFETMLANWNDALRVVAPAVTPDTPRPLVTYGTALRPEDLSPIPECDLPAGLPGWMGSVDAWASRKIVDEAEGASATQADKDNAKRATIVVKIPRNARTWPANPQP
jgi:hypothetical protein